MNKGVGINVYFELLILLDRNCISCLNYSISLGLPE
jgi:hypothetical protein